jgi:YVTN family beta-propeller protein
LGAALLVANDGTVSQIDPRRNAVVSNIPVGDGPTALTTGVGAVWVVHRESDRVSVIDPRTAEVVQTIPVPDGPDAIAAGAGAVWVASLGGTVTKIVPR